MIALGHCISIQILFISIKNNNEPKQQQFTLHFDPTVSPHGVSVEQTNLQTNKHQHGKKKKKKKKKTKNIKL